MSASLTIGIYDPTSAYTQYYNNVANTLQDAFDAWMSHFDYTTGNLTIDVDFEAMGGEEAASAGPAGTTLVGTNNGVGVLASSFATQLYSGTSDADGGPTDGVLTIDTSYLAEAFAPSQTSDTYDDRLGILEHEIGHMLGFDGFYDPTTDTLTDPTYESGYDQYVSFINGTPYFTGPNAEADYGSAVPLDTSTIYHPYVPGEISVMSYEDQASSIQNLDVEILKDTGLPILTTEEEIEHSIIRVYLAAFGNAGDTADIEHWTNLITNNKATLSDVAASLMNSAEFTDLYGSGTSNTAFVDALYQNVLGRSDDGTYWVNTLNAGASRADVLNDFAQSDEHRADLEQNANVSYSSSSEAEILRIYESAFGRVPDPSGYNYWVNTLNIGASLNDVAASFLGSPEFDARYSTDLSDNGFVTALYENALGRAPDSPGLQYWTALLQNGTLTRSEELLSFSDSPEHITEIAQLATARNLDGYAVSTQAILGLIPNQTAQTATS